MRVYGQNDYKIGLVIGEFKVIHRGHMRIISEALSASDEVIVCMIDYDTNYFGYSFFQKCMQQFYDKHSKISFFGITSDKYVKTPKQYILKAYDELQIANYNMPTHLFTTKPDWIAACLETQLNPIQCLKVAGFNSEQIFDEIKIDVDSVSDLIPYVLKDEYKQFLATEERKKYID